MKTKEIIRSNEGKIVFILVIFLIVLISALIIYYLKNYNFNKVDQDLQSAGGEVINNLSNFENTQENEFFNQQ